MLSPLKSSLSASCMLVGAALLGCAPGLTMVGRPAPMPVPSEAAVNDLRRLIVIGCLTETDPLVSYLLETENYRIYVCRLREDPNCSGGE